MGTDALSLLITVALFIVGLWLIMAFAKGLLFILGVVLVIVAVINIIRWIVSRGS